jgi:hypothetical protein
MLVLALSATGQEVVTPYGTTGTPLDGAAATPTGVTTVTGATGKAAPKPFRAARLTWMQGDVRVEQANATANSVAVVNMPLVEGSVISTSATGEAEIEFEDGSVARLTPNSGVSLLNLSSDTGGIFHTRIAVLGGLAYFELRAGTKYRYSVDAGGDAISPVENATVRVNFDQPPAAITVLDGSVHVVSAVGGATADVNAGQTVRGNAGSDGGVYLISSNVAAESWDRWNEDRDAGAANEAEQATDARNQFAGNQGYGWSDLDANGTWYDVPGHGKIWQPDMAAQTDDQSPETGGDQGGDAGQADAGQAGFDPYGYGSWVWTPAGYSWASGYGWGWLPYRCGQWSWFDGFGWAWTPSPVCGLFGFGGYGYGGYGYGVNLGPGPGGYRRPHRPVQGPGPAHPIVHGPGEPMKVWPAHRQGGERVIAGTTAEPLQPIGSGFVASGGGVLGSALRRDYPVDQRTQMPVSGVVSMTHGMGFGTGTMRAGWQPGSPVRQPYGGSPERPYLAPRYQPPQGVPGGGQGGGPGGGQGGGRTAQPRPSAPPAPRAPAAAPASHSAPAASSAKGK